VQLKLSPCSQFAAASTGTDTHSPSTIQRTTAAKPPIMIIVVARSRSTVFAAMKNNTISASTPSAHNAPATSLPMPYRSQCTVDSE